MNGPAPNLFRGYRAVADVVEKMTGLADWLSANKSSCTVMTLKRRDLDLLQRWPEAAGSFHIVTNNGRTYWRGFELRADTSPPRYVGRSGNT